MFLTLFSPILFSFSLRLLTILDFPTWTAFNDGQFSLNSTYKLLIYDSYTLCLVYADIFKLICNYLFYFHILYIFKKIQIKSKCWYMCQQLELNTVDLNIGKLASEIYLYYIPNNSSVARSFQINIVLNWKQPFH